jgi:hypothetical protein
MRIRDEARQAASVAKGRQSVNSSEIFTATLPRILGVPESLHCI